MIRVPLPTQPPCLLLRQKQESSNQFISFKEQQVLFGQTALILSGFDFKPANSPGAFRFLLSTYYGAGLFQVLGPEE